ncbi:MAG: hypothetical protein CMP40_01050 [Rickettsiales bacterium]|mgnify:FL=1|nr:hypothetical protein [Rickettsiales bacterium]
MIVLVMNFFTILFLLCVFFSMGSCTRGGVPLLSTGVSGTEGLPAEQLSFAKFKDIPIPDGAVMDMKNTVIFGSDEDWFGRLALLPNMSHAETFDFFRYEMPNLNWLEITNVRATSSVLSYEKNSRVVTIQISNSYGQTICSINMSPKKK